MITMNNIEVSYFNGSQWTDLSSYVNRVEVKETGIQAVSSAIVNFKTMEQSNIQDFISNPYRLMRVRANIGNWQNLFVGFLNQVYVTSIAGVIGNKVKVSLDMNGIADRLVADTITFDYYKLQMAISPYVSEESWTFRRMIEDYLAYPDSYGENYPYGTGFQLDAPADPNGIDSVIDATGNWENQTLFEANRIVAERLGMDGYYYRSDYNTPPYLYLRKFDKSPKLTLSPPFISESKWVSGARNDVCNVIFLEGGVDAGVPSDGDKWTEYAISKYSPDIWVPTRTNASNIASDVDNTVFTDENLRVNSKCVKLSTKDSTDLTFYATLYVSRTEAMVVNAEKRVSGVAFNLKTYGLYFQNNGCNIDFILVDIDGNEIISRLALDNNTLLITEDFEKAISLELLSTPSHFEEGFLTPQMVPNKWYYNTGSSFNKSKIIKFVIRIKFVDGVQLLSGHEFGLYIDGFQFVGGEKITPFHPLNPPVIDETSINTYNIHVYRHVDSTISSFEQAAAEKNRLLNNLKSPISTLTISQAASTTQLFPSDVVRVNGVDYRIAELKYEWNARGSRDVITTYNLIAKTSPLPPIWTRQNELRYLIK